MRNRPLALLLAFLWIWMSVPSVPAEERRPAPVAAVVGFKTSGDLIERQTLDYLAKRLAKSKRLLLVSESEVEKQLSAAWRAEQTPAKTSLDQAYRRYVEGRKLYEKLEIESAILAFDDAVRGYREGIAALRENRYLLASHLYLGIALQVLGRQAEGTEYLRQMIILDPSRATQLLPVREFPPKVVNLHKALSAEIVRGPSGKVSIRSTPPGASVYFDGVQQAPTPVELDRVPVGEHFVLVEKRGYRRYASRVDVKTAETRLEPALEQWDPLAPQSFDARSNADVNAHLMNVGKGLGAKILVLGEVVPGSGDEVRLRGQVYDVMAAKTDQLYSAR